MNATDAQLFWWVALPYFALGVFVVGHVWRWRYDQFGWTSRSTQLQERRLLKWGGPIFHYGTFAAIAGHVIGVLIPERWTKAIGIPEQAYRWFSAGAGTVAGADGKPIRVLAVVPLADAVTLPQCALPPSVIVVPAFHGGLLGDSTVLPMVSSFLAGRSVTSADDGQLHDVAELITGAAGPWRMPDTGAACPFPGG